MCWKFYGRLCPLSHSARATKIQVFIRSDTSVQSFPFKDNHNGSLFGSVSINFNSCRSLRNYMKPSKCDHCAASVSVSASRWKHSGRFSRHQSKLRFILKETFSWPLHNADMNFHLDGYLLFKLQRNSYFVPLYFFIHSSWSHVAVGLIVDWSLETWLKLITIC